MKTNIYLESIKKNLTMAVMLKDELSPDKKAIGDVFLTISFKKQLLNHKQLIRHSTGYYPFIDLPQGEYVLTAGGNFYRHENFLMHLFIWDEVKGNDSIKLVEFLRQKFGLGWIKTATIEKIDNLNIKLTAEKNYLFLGLNNEKSLSNLKIDDFRNAQFTAQNEEGKLTIYFLINPKSVNPKEPCVDLFLRPKACYPFPEGITVLKGKIVDTGGKPIPGASIQIKGMNESAISEKEGSFFIQFGDIERDKKIDVIIKKNEYKAEHVKIVLKKGCVTRAEAIKLTKA
jgi:hypothetical protein